MTRSELAGADGHIRAIRWYPYQIPFLQSFATAHGPLTRRDGAIVEIITEEGYTGIGEIAPLPEFSGASLANALSVLPAYANQFQGRTLSTALLKLEEDTCLPPTLQSGLELALFDALGQQAGKSLANMLNAGQSKTTVSVNAVVGARKLAEAVQQAHKAVEQGFPCIKLKMVGEENEQIARVAAVRESIGSAIHLRLDANEGWSLEQGRRILKACERFQIQYVEHPLPAIDIAGMRALQNETTIPLAADEAVNSLTGARKLLEAHAASVLSLKPQLIGGLRNTRKIILEAKQLNVACVITSSIETGIGLAGALHLAAASPEITLPCGLATLELLADDLLTNALNIRHGEIAVPEAPGLGVTLDRAALARYGQ